MRNMIWVIALLACVSCTVEGKKEQADNPLIGTAWQMDYSMEVNKDSTFSHVPESWIRIKMYTGKRWTFTGYDFGKQEVAGMAGGTYTLDGKAYTEQIEFHYHAPFNGKTFEAELWLEGDYLYQRGKVDSLVLEERWHRID